MCHHQVGGTGEYVHQVSTLYGWDGGISTSSGRDGGNIYIKWAGWGEYLNQVGGMGGISTSSGWDGGNIYIKWAGLLDGGISTLGEWEVGGMGEYQH